MGMSEEKEVPEDFGGFSLNDRMELIKELNLGVPSMDGRRTLNDKTYNLREVKSIHREAIRMLVNGIKPKVIAKYLGITPQTVSNLRNHPLALKQLKTLEDLKDDKATVMPKINEFKPDAIEALGELVNDKDIRSKAVRLAAAKEILDRTDGKAVQKVDVHRRSIIEQHILELKATARDIGVLPEGQDSQDSQDELDEDTEDVGFVEEVDSVEESS